MLPAKTVRAILRELAAVHSIAEIARRHGVSHQAVSDIKHGRTASAQRILAAGLDRALDDVDEPETARASAGRPFKLASAQDEMLYWYMQLPVSQQGFLLQNGFKPPEASSDLRRKLYIKGERQRRREGREARTSSGHWRYALTGIAARDAATNEDAAPPRKRRAPRQSRTPAVDVPTVELPSIEDGAVQD